MFSKYTSLGVYGVSVRIVCRYRSPKHIKIHKSASGQFYLTQPTTFDSIPVTVVATLSCHSLLTLTC